MFKRTTALIIGVMLLTTAFCGCSTTPEETLYTVSEIYESDSDSFFNHKAEVPNMSVEDFQDKNALTEKSFEFMGSTYDLLYSYSSLRYVSKEEIQIYKVKDNKNLSMAFSKKTGELTGLGSALFPIKYGSGIENKESVISLADNLIKDFIDVDKYDIREFTSSVLIEKENSTSGESYDYFYTAQNEYESVTYEYKYVRSISGIPTNEMAIVKITEDGYLAGFYIYNKGAFDNITVPQIDNNKYVKSVESKLKSIYETSNYTKKNSKEKTKYIAIGKDGKPILYTGFEVTVLNKKTNKEFPGELCELVVYLD